MKKSRQSATAPVADRIKAHTKNDLATGCWVWAKHVDRDGYGRIRIAGKDWLAHRASYSHLVGPIPRGLTIDHLCRNRSCVNPAHLEPVTHTENVRRGTGRGPGKRGTHCHRGHAYDDANTYTYKGDRQCRKCNVIRAAAYKLRRRA